MRFRASLRYRITLAFALLGLVVSLVSAGSLYLLTIDMEERLIAETLSAELEEYIARYAVDPKAIPPASTTIRTYVILPETKGVPATLQGMKAGLHQVQLEGKNYYAEVRVNDNQHFIVLYDVTQVLHREDQFMLFLGFGVLFMTLISALLGLWLTGRIISPVGDLALRVADLHPEDHPAPLAQDFPRDEVGLLARNFDAYLHRLAAFIEREQAFTADVSHELRTPLAVITGAADVLLDDPDLDEARRLRVERIVRSTREMSELVTALLLLSREKQDDDSGSGCIVSEALQQVMESHQYLVSHKSVKINLDIQCQTTLPVECSLLRVVLANLIRNAISYTEHGQVSICLDDKGVTVNDTGIGIPKEQLQRIFDRYYTGSHGGEGIGLSIVKRICHRYGWNINVDSHEGIGTQISLSFASSSTRNLG